MNIFSLIWGLEEVCPGAKYTGSFVLHDEDEYNAIVWKDVRPKPDYTILRTATLNILRRNIADAINTVTTQRICYGFRFSIEPDIPVWSDFEWQFDVSALVAHAEWVQYPYQLKASENKDASTNYIEIANVDILRMMESEFFTYVLTELYEGRELKNTLKYKSRILLENFIDTRVVPQKVIL